MQNIEIEYLQTILFCSVLQKLCGGSAYCDANFDRIKLHAEICKKYNIDHNICANKLTDKLDKEIGLDLEVEYSDEEVEVLAKKFIAKLEALRGTNGC